MENSKVNWKPQNILALILGVFGGAIVILLYIGTDKSMSEILGKAGIGVLAGGVSGYFSGLVIKVLMKNLTESSSLEFFEIPENLSFMESSSGVEDISAAVTSNNNESTTNESDAKSLRQGISASDGSNVDNKVNENEREEVMASNST